jgi:hypothetical protein
VKYPLAISVLLLPVLLAGEETDRAKLFGSWQTPGQSDTQTTWTLAMHEDVVHISVSQANRKLSEFECAASGRECEVKIDGKTAKVSIWFNGPKLVMMETRGSEVEKLRFSTVSEGTQMDIETIPIVPGGKPEILHFTRVSSSQ